MALLIVVFTIRGGVPAGWRVFAAGGLVVLGAVTFGATASLDEPPALAEGSEPGAEDDR